MLRGTEKTSQHYGAELWTIKDKQESRIAAAEIKFHTNALGKTRKHKIRNIIIRENLGLRAPVELVERKVLGLYGHLLTRDTGIGLRRVFKERPAEGRRRRRPRTEWKELYCRIGRKERKICTKIEDWFRTDKA